MLIDSTDYFGSDVSEGHYNSVPSAEACQQDCQVGDYDLYNDDGEIDDNHSSFITVTVRSSESQCTVMNLMHFQRLLPNVFSGPGMQDTTAPAGTSLLRTRSVLLSAIHYLLAWWVFILPASKPRHLQWCLLTTLLRPPALVWCPAQNTAGSKPHRWLNI